MAMRHKQVKPILLLIFSIVFVWLAGPGWSHVPDIQLQVMPHHVTVRVNPSQQTFFEISGGLQASVFPFSRFTQGTLHMSLTPLVDANSGRQLPADRLLISLGEGRPVPIGSTVLPISRATRFRLWVRPELYDAPGLYQGQLCLTVNCASAQAVAHVDVHIQVLPWVVIRRLAPSPLMITSPGSFGPEGMMSSERIVLLVAGNDSWQLLVQASDPLSPLSGPATTPLAEQIGMRVFANEWVQPVTDDLVQVTTDSPALLATGKATGDCGWAAVDLQVGMPLTRRQVAGVYMGELTLSVAPY
jgi:hypothetical protein